MLVSHLDKLVKTARAKEVMLLLSKTATAQQEYPAPAPQGMVSKGVDLGLSGMGYGADGYSVYHGGQGIHGAGSALAQGQGVRAAGRAAIQPFASAAVAPGAKGIGATLGRVAVPVFGAMSAAETASGLRDQYNTAKAYKNSGRNYMTSQQGIHDTVNTVANASTLIGMGVGSLVPGVGTAVGGAVGYTAGLGLKGVNAVAKGISGYDADKNAQGMASVQGQGYGSVEDFAQHGLEMAGGVNAPTEATSTGWFGKKRDFRQEALDSYIKSEQKAAQDSRSSTNKGQVA